MRILGWSIDGFGVFNDYETRDLPEGLTVFHGPNEAGKSTLLAYLRGALFGFPDKRRRTNQYEPLRGGRHGGRVFLLGEDGEYTVERYAKTNRKPRVLLPDGSEGTEQDLHALFGGADETLFSNVFAFSLSELHSMESLTREGVSDRIFSAGIAGAGRDAREAIKALDARAAELLKSRGKARLNELGKELAELRAKLKSAREASGGYAELAAQERAATKEIEDLSRRATELQREQSRCETLTKLWPVWAEVVEAKRELEQTEPIHDFPQDPGIRLDSALKDVRQAERHLEERRREKALLEEKLAKLESDDGVAAVAGEIEALYNELSLHQERLGSLSGAREAAQRAGNALDEKLADLGADWSVEKLDAFDPSIPRSEEVRGWEARLRKADEALETARRRFETAGERTREIVRRRDRLVQSLPHQEPPPLDELNQADSALRTLRANRDELRAAENDLESREILARDRERALRDLESVPEPVRLKPARLACWVGAGLAIAGAVASFVMAAAWIGVGLLAVGVAFAVVARLTAKFEARLDQRRARREEETEAVRREWQQASEEAASLRATRDRLAQSVSNQARVAGLPAQPTAQQIEERAAEKDAARRARQEWDRIGKEIAETESDVKHAREEQEAAGRAFEEAKSAQRNAREEWRQWRAQAGVEADLAPQGALDSFTAVRVARDAARQARQADEQAEALKRELEAWEARARAALEKAGDAERAAERGDGLVAAIRDWKRRCAEDAERRRSRLGLEENLREIEARIGAAEAELTQAVEERDRLFRQAGAEDEESYRRRMAVNARRDELDAVIRDGERQIRVTLGSGEEAEEWRRELESGRSQEWSRRLKEVADELEIVRGQRDEALRMHRDAETELKRLAESADVVALENQMAQGLAEFTDAVEEWRAAAAARGLIGETLKEFERNRQPEVLAQASHWFERVTSGRHVRLSQGESEGELLVHDRRGGARRVDELSRGTAEQLYVCIRLGLAAEFSRRTQPMPFVMDDVLVNFDPARRRAMAEALIGFAEGRQILFFTCHPDMRDLFVEAGDVTALELEAGAVPA